MHVRTVTLFLLAAASLVPGRLWAQGCGNLNLTWQADIASSCQMMTMTMIPDRSGRSYLYVAEKEGGLRIYNVSVAGAPKAVASVMIDKLDSLHVMSVTQDGKYLFLALGNSFGTATQSPGMAIVDFTNPESPIVTDVYRSSAADGGGGIVTVHGDYAYLGAMTHGLVVLDVSDKHAIRFVSQFMPDRSFPVAKPDTAKYNARGMEVRGDIVYLCFDAGGVRTIDVSDKQHPREIGRYSEPALDKLARAYNNIVLNDTLAYVTFDYCGVEVLSVADPSNIRLVSWWNPWNCQSNPLNWYSSPGHANEIAYNSSCKLLFVATGKSDLYVLDASDPARLDSCSMYGGVNNNMGTWGVAIADDRVYLSYVCAVIPFASNWTGVKVLSYTPCAAGNNGVEPTRTVTLHYYITAEGILAIDSVGFQGNVSATLTNSLGVSQPISVQRIGENLCIDLSKLVSGVYFFALRTSDSRQVIKVIR